MENLDNDVLGNILFRLPLREASLRAKRVCKSWKSILDDRHRNEAGFIFACRENEDNKIQLYFGKQYDHIDCNRMNYYYSHETLMEMEHGRFALKSHHYELLVGSCNGLVCFHKEDPGVHTPEPFAVCNPLTGEIIFLKENFSRVWNELLLVTSGFGYCHSTNEYKVVRIYAVDGQMYGSNFQVYTIGSNKWRDIDTFIMDLTFSVSGVFANGVLHWLDDDDVIVTFDLEDEEVGKLPLPPPEVLKRPDLFWSNTLKLLGGNLCWVQHYSSRMDIWAYKRNNNRKEEHNQKRDYYNKNSWNWIKDFSIERDLYYEPFSITKSNQVLMLCRKDFLFYCYDPKTQTISKLGDDNGMDKCSRIEAIPHTNSYVSLKDSGETWCGPGCSEADAAPLTKYYLSLIEVRDAFLRHKRKRQADYKKKYHPNSPSYFIYREYLV